MNTSRFMKPLLLMVACLALGACNSERKTTEYYKMALLQPNTAMTTWNPEDYDFQEGNEYYLKMYEKGEETMAAGCSSWRNGRYHGRNLDWFQSNFGALVIQMPKGGKVKHASVAMLNGISTVTQQFIQDGVITDEQKKILPCLVVDGINDAGVAANINIVTHAPSSIFISKEGDLSSQCVVRYVLDNAGSVDEAISLLEARKVRQSIVNIAGDETHYMISDKDKTAVVEFDNGEMVVTTFNNTEDGCYSDKGTPAIMTNLYNFAIERWGLGTEEFFENHPYAMGVERWQTISQQYGKAAQSVESNLAIAQSVWYFKNFMQEKKVWYTENAIPAAYGKDSLGWYYKVKGERNSCADYKAAQQGYWDNAMEQYWADYEQTYGKQDDPHVKGNAFWETSHTVIFDLKEKKGYLYPFENYYSGDGKPIILALP